MDRVQLALGASEHELRTLLCLGAYCDDIEIGCGGTVLRLAEQHPGMRVHWVMLSSTPVRAAEARQSAEHFLRRVRHKEIVIAEFRTSFSPFAGGEIKEFFEDLKGRIALDLVLTHRRRDLHQAHRVTCELTWNAFRDHFILEYEILKFDGDLRAPDFFMALEPEDYASKVEFQVQCFPS